MIPSRGSVGSSGDLAPLAHLALVLIGEGEATVGGERLPGGEALARAGLAPVALAAKEGLALINGTHLMAAAGGLAMRDAERVLDAAVVAAALSLEAFKGSTVPFDERLHARARPARAGAGGRAAARAPRRLAGGRLARRLRPRPGPLHAALRAAGARARSPTRSATRAAALERELSAVTDNPLVFADDAEILSGGNFHGQPLSLPLDHLALAMCELASFAERRVYALLTPSYAELPAFLTPRPGLSSGLMIAQYAAAALVSECQVLSHPAGAGSIPTSAGMEDFNSMGALAALKARTVVGHAAHVVATELVCACQGLEFHRPLRSTDALEGALAQVRAVVPRLEEDRSLAGELEALAGALRTGDLVLARNPSGVYFRPVPAYTATKPQLLARLKRIEGQTRGVQKMVDEDRYCIDVLTQISAIQAALDKVALGLLDEHVKHCVVEGHGPGSQEELTEEMMGAIGRLLAR